MSYSMPSTERHIDRRLLGLTKDNPGGGSNEPEDDDAADDDAAESSPSNGEEVSEPVWTADQLLDALRRAIEREHGSAEADRLWAIAQSFLQPD